MEEQKLLKRKRKAETENNQTLLITTCTDLAELYVKEGRYNQAVEEYTVVGDIYKSQNKLMEYAQANRAIGEAYMGLHEFEKALQHQRIYLNVANTEGDKLEQQRALANMGHIYLTWHLETQSDSSDKNLNSAYKYLMKSLKIADSLSGINKLKLADILARLYSNLGVVKESQGDFEYALKLINRSISICKQNDINEQLSRGYISIASLCEKRGNYNDAIHHYNLAIDSAKKIKNDVELMCAALLAKSETLVKLADFHSAKQVLLKAYKLKLPNIQERKIIERRLRIVAVMCNTEDKLLVIGDNEKERKKLYETMGDGACELKNYAKAIEYYKLMLQCAERSGVSGRDLACCYYSLAETYKDNNQFAEAVDYFEKEYELCTDLKDNLNTLSKIADTKEAAGAAVEEVKAVYERSFSNCRSRRNVKEEKRMISRCILYLRRNDCHTDAFQLSQYLHTLDETVCDEESSSSDCESEDSEAKANIGDNINLDDITDDSDIENKQSPHKQDTSVGKRRSKNFVIKKNAKGESQLHTACINGSMPVVRHLVEQGHPVNVRDNSGWLPLHEACNHGHVEIVKYLLDKGAAINDRGGTHCNGITPLYDAANNGHLQVVELLLDKGASAIVKTDEGGTPLNVLKVWQELNPVHGDDLSLYNSLVRRMSEAMEKAGQSTKSTSELMETSPRPAQRETCARRSGLDTLDDDSLSWSGEISSQTTDSGGVSEYKEIMGSLRNKTGDDSGRKVSPSSWKRSALVSVDDNLDDWLEDDMRMSKATKKRKMSHVAESMLSSDRVGERNSTSPKERISDDNEIPQSFFDEDFENEPIPEQRSTPDKQDRRSSSESRTSTGSNAKRRNQTSLFDAGFSRVRSVTPTFKRTSSFENRNKPQQQKLTNMGHTRDVVEADSTTIISSQTRAVQENAVGDLMLYVDVKIEGMVFRVPVLLSQVETNTIRWLAEQAATKYARKQCTRPTLELETTTGALLSDDDPLKLLFPLGATQAEPVVGRVVKLNLPPLVERYREACSLMNTDINTSLCTILEELSITLSLKDNGFLGKSLSPLCKALNYQTSLLELDLSGNFLDSDSFLKLCSSLPTLTNLCTLNLRCTGLVSGHLTELVKVLTSTTDPILQKLSALDLSDNFLQDKSFPHLAQITSRLTLTSLNLSNVQFTGDIFRDSNEGLSLNLSEIQNLDLSDNQLSTSDLSKFISWTVGSKLIALNVSRNNPDNRGVLENLIELFREEQRCLVLKTLNISRCNVTENELYEILRLCSEILDLNLSYNDKLTGISLRRLLERSSLERVNLIGCDDIFKYFDDCGGCDLLEGSDGNGNKVLKMSPNLGDYPGQVETLIDMFRNKYSDLYIEKGSNFLLLSSRGLNER